MSSNIYKKPKSGPKSGPTKRLTTEEFIAKARKVHGNRYDYSKADYKNATTKVIIICKEHGEFEQLPFNHFKYGCPKCGHILTTTKRSYTTKEFTVKARKVHGSKYDYSKVVYKNTQTKVKIICPKHGEFLQKPNNHISGSGCPGCYAEIRTGPGFDRSSDTKSGFLYLIICELGPGYFCKIGTAYNTKKRFSGFPFEIKETKVIPGIRCDVEKLEKQVKREFKKFQYIPKVKFSGYTECFRIEAYPKIRAYLGL